MHCNEARAYAEDREALHNLSRETQLEVLMHLRWCEACREEIDTAIYLHVIETVIMANE